MNRTPLATRRLSTALAVLVAGSTLAACSSSSEQEREKVDATKLVTSLPAADSDVDRIAWNVAGEPDTLDPRNSVSYGNGAIVRNMCEGLMKMDENFDVTPNLATPEEVSPTELRLKIRDDVTFWDGRPLTADDVLYSLERSAAPDSYIAGGFAFVDDMQVTGDHEVTITFKRPDSSFIDNLGSLSGVVMQKAWGEKTGSKIGTSTGGLMCTGPFKFGSWKSGASITIERNDDYWNTENLRPWAKEVEFTFLADDTAVAQALEAGELDGSYEVPASILAKLDAADSGQLVFGPSTQSASIYVARPDGQLADLKLRDALHKIVDREAIADVVYHGGAEPNYTKLTPATWPNAERDMYQPEYDKWVEARQYDPEAAKKLVEESSYDGSTLQLAIMAGDQAASQIAQLFQQEAKKVGVNVNIKTMQPLVYDQATYDESRRKGIDLIYSSSFNSRQNPLEPLRYDLLPGEAYNYTDFDNAEVVRMMDEARASFDPKERAELVVEMQKLYEPETSTIALVSTNTALFLNNDLTGAITSFAYWSMPQMAYIGGKS